jgi:hypothetical protein
MKALLLNTAFAIAVIAVGTPSYAAVIPFTYSGTNGSGIGGAFSLTTGTVNPSGSFFTPSVLVTGISGTFDGQSITGLSAPGAFYKTAGIFGSPGNDNILYYPSTQTFNGSPTYLDRYGLSFSTATDEFNIYFGLGGYGLLDQRNGTSTVTSNIGGQLTLVSAQTAVPEPLTLSLFGAGIAGILLIGRRKRNASRTASS